MDIDAIGSETVIRHRPGGEDGMGNPEPDTAPPVTYQGCATHPRGDSTEASGRSLTTIVGRTFYLPYVEPDIASGDELEWRGQRYPVEGEAVLWTHLDGSQAGTEVHTQKAKG